VTFNPPFYFTKLRRKTLYDEVGFKRIENKKIRIVNKERGLLNPKGGRESERRRTYFRLDGSGGIF
jgi:hypothetical protein